MQRGTPLAASTLIGTPVRDTAGDRLGRIEDLVMDSSTNRVSFGVLSLGGFPEMGNRLVLVPWENLGALSGRDYLLLDMDKNVLMRAPAFDRKGWPHLSDQTWRDRVYGYYGYSEPVVAREPIVGDRRDYGPRRREMSVVGSALLILLLVGLLAFGYLIATHGWEQTKNEVLNSLQGVTYAMKDTSSDAALTTKVKAALSLNKRVPSGSINVDSQEGVVTLRGDVNDDETRQLAEAIAQDTPGVREVRNHLYVMSSDGK